MISAPEAGIIHDLLRGEVDRAVLISRIADAILAFDPYAIPPAEPGMLLSAVAAFCPDTDPGEVRQAIATQLWQANLEETRQPALDELFRMLETLALLNEAELLQPLLIELLSSGRIHPRWIRKSIHLLEEVVFWHAARLDLESLIDLACTLDEEWLAPLFANVIEPVAFTRVATLTVDQIDRLTARPEQLLAAKYFLYALAGCPDAGGELRAVSSKRSADLLPLKPLWKRLAGGRPLNVLCIHNIADGLGDEIVRINPLLQALLDGQQETTITLVSDRPALWSHPRLKVISFDDSDAINAALEARPDVLFSLHERDNRHLNHDPRLIEVKDELLEEYEPLLHIEASKGWNGFVFDVVRINGMEWAQATGVNRLRGRSAYDPVSRLIAELGLPLRIGSMPPASGSLLASTEPHAAETWQQLINANAGNRPVTLINPFGGSAGIKGFVERKLDDLTRLLGQVIDDGNFVVVVPNSDPWGSPEIARRAIEALKPDQQKHVAVGPLPVRRDLTLQCILHAISVADRVITIEGWMGHAAWAMGRPVETLIMPHSEGRAWLPWGRDTYQQPRLFRGSPELDNPPLPEQPRKHAWLQLIRRAHHRDLQSLLESALLSEDIDIRRAATLTLRRIRDQWATRKLEELLNDRDYRVRGIAAGTLLDRGSTILPASTLWSFRLIGSANPNWKHLEAAGITAKPALQAALQDANPVIRREAAFTIEYLGRKLGLNPNWMDEPNV